MKDRKFFLPLFRGRIVWVAVMLISFVLLFKNGGLPRGSPVGAQA
jgi:hypothetical protein